MPHHEEGPISDLARLANLLEGPSAINRDLIREVQDAINDRRLPDFCDDYLGHPISEEALRFFPQFYSYVRDYARQFVTEVEGGRVENSANLDLAVIKTILQGLDAKPPKVDLAEGAEAILNVDSFGERLAQKINGQLQSPKKKKFLGLFGESA